MKKVQFANGALAEAGFSGLKLNDINKFMTGKIARILTLVAPKVYVDLQHQRI
jgi:hypothetical protein